MTPETFKRQGYKYLTILITLTITLYMVTAVVQNRLMQVGNVYICAAILIYPLSYLLLDIITEVYGYKIARQIIWCGILAWILSGLLITLVIHLPAPTFWITYANQFDFVMAPYLRSILSGTIAVIAGQFLNIYFVSKFKILMRGKYFWLRSISSCVMGDVITIFIAIFFIFVGRMPIENILRIASYEFIISFLLQSFFAFPSNIIVILIKHSEGIDTYDDKISFNPFSLETE